MPLPVHDEREEEQLHQLFKAWKRRDEAQRELAYRQDRYEAAMQGWIRHRSAARGSVDAWEQVHAAYQEWMQLPDQQCKCAGFDHKMSCPAWVPTL